MMAGEVPVSVEIAGTAGEVVRDCRMTEAGDLERQRADRQGAAAGSWYLMILGISLAVIGGVFCALMWRSYDRARQMHAWPEVPCVILQSEVVESRHDDQSPFQYQLVLSYGYEVDGVAFTGERLGLRGNPRTTKRGVVEKLAGELAVGTRTTCRVNPDDPKLAVLRPDSKAPGYSIWFPGLFVVGGLGMAMRAGSRLIAQDRERQAG
jgi:hypothetical protein